MKLTGEMRKIESSNGKKKHKGKWLELRWECGFVVGVKKGVEALCMCMLVGTC